ncbi:MAG TPA: hypothetical protein VFB50_09230 [Chloroflexota bacterium]|nr:hypothetical protein [Chloroflexota bacterium]
MAQLTVSYERKFSDRNYGSEGLSMHWTWDQEEEEDEPVKENLERTAGFLRELVLGQLAQSAGSEDVRWAAHHELYWKRAQESAEVELAAGLRDNARGEDTQEDLPF